MQVNEIFQIVSPNTFELVVEVAAKDQHNHHRISWSQAILNTWPTYSIHIIYYIIWYHMISSFNVKIKNVHKYSWAARAASPPDLGIWFFLLRWLRRWQACSRTHSDLMACQGHKVSRFNGLRIPGILIANPCGGAPELRNLTRI